MQVKDVPRIGFTPGRTMQQKRELPVGLGVPGEIVVHHEGMASSSHPMLGYGAAGERRQIAEARQGVRFGHHQHGVSVRSRPDQRFPSRGDRRACLTDEYYD